MNNPNAILFSGEHLRLLRQYKKESRPQLAKALGTSEILLTKWETDQETPDKLMLFNLANHFDVLTNFFKPVGKHISMPDEMTLTTFSGFILSASRRTVDHELIRTCVTHLLIEHLLIYVKLSDSTFVGFDKLRDETQAIRGNGKWDNDSIHEAAELIKSRLCLEDVDLDNRNMLVRALEQNGIFLVLSQEKFSNPGESFAVHMDDGTPYIIYSKMQDSNEQLTRALGLLLLYPEKVFYELDTTNLEHYALHNDAIDFSDHFLGDHNDGVYKYTRPLFVCKSIQLLVEGGVFSLEGILKLLGVKEAFLEDLLDLPQGYFKNFSKDTLQEAKGSASHNVIKLSSYF